MTILADEVPAFSGEPTGEYGSGYLEFEKGVSDFPFELEHDVDAGIVTVRFDEAAPALCGCSVQCQDYFGETCIDGKGPVFVISNVDFSDGDPIELNIVLFDQFGNQSTFTAWSLIAIEPETPELTLEDGPRQAVLTILAETVHGASLEEAATDFQVERYLGVVSNRRVLVDWTPVDDLAAIYDLPVPPDVTLGYRVRWRAQDGHVSPWSSWATISS